MIIKIHRDKITFREKHLRTKKGRNAQKSGEYYQQIKKSIEKYGIINPLICIQDGDMYKICLGMKRFIIGCDLGIQEFDIKVVPSEDVELLKEENLKYKSTDTDNAYFKFMKQN